MYPANRLLYLVNKGCPVKYEFQRKKQVFIYCMFTLFGTHIQKKSCLCEISVFFFSGNFT